MIPIFATDSSTRFYLLYILWHPLSFLQQPFQCFWPNLIFPSPSKHSPRALPPLLALLCKSTPLFYLTPCLILHVCLLSSSGFFFVLLLTWCWNSVMVRAFFSFFLFLQCFAYIRCSVHRFDDWELAVCRCPTIFSRVI